MAALDDVDEAEGGAGAPDVAKCAGELYALLDGMFRILEEGQGFVDGFGILLADGKEEAILAACLREGLCEASW